MSDIEFDADVQGNPRYSSRPSVAGGMSSGVQYQQSGNSRIGMANWLIRHGIINRESSAKGFLIALIVINFIASGLILYFFVLR